MGSLTAHLRETGDHGRLRFHPSCPVCRAERLSGALSSEPVVSRRAQALLAGGVLAFSAPASTAAGIPEPDQQLEGVAAPDQPGGQDLDDPGFDPGGDTDLPFETAPAPATSDGSLDEGAGAPVDTEPSVDLDAQLVPPTEAETPGAEQGSGTEAETPAPEQDSGTPPAEVVLPDTSSTPAGPVTLGELTGTKPPTPVPPAPAGEGAPRDGADRGGRELGRGPRRSPYGAEGPVGRPPGPPAQTVEGTISLSPLAPTVAPVAVTPSPATRTAPASVAIEKGAPVYVVQSGDSLWSIAKRLLGPEASVARIAREVDRLWSLNRSRIATGDPDLLMVGTRLELR
jgi:nucleoid-associated protein YgaU